jgi:hypothetical protein
VLVLAWIAISALLACVAFGPGAARRIGRLLLTGGTLSVLFNLWWIVPAALTISSPVFAKQYMAPGVAGALTGDRYRDRRSSPAARKSRRSGPARRGSRVRAANPARAAVPRRALQARGTRARRVPRLQRPP